MAHREVSFFKQGFALKGFNANETGSDIIRAYKSQSTWRDDSEKEVGTPIQIDTTKDRELKVCPDGEVPDGFLETRVGNTLSDYEMMLNLYPVSEVRPGEPVDFVKFVPGGVLETKLFVEEYTPVVNDYIYVKDGAFIGTDPLDGEGKYLGKIIEVDSDNEYAEILLNTGITNTALVEKVAKVNIIAPEDGNETETGFVIPENAAVTKLLVRVNVKEETGDTKTIDIGTDSNDGGDPDGYLAGINVANTGLIKGTLDNSGQTLGELLTVDEDGSGVLVPEIDIASGGKKLTFTAGSADFAELDADIFVFYYDLD